jgi:hypothetical protein
VHINQFQGNNQPVKRKHDADDDLNEDLVPSKKHMRVMTESRQQTAHEGMLIAEG